MSQNKTAQRLMPDGPSLLDSPARSALREAAAALDVAERFQQPLEMCLALAQMARCYRALQAPGAAELYLERAWGWARTLGAADQGVEILCLLAETNCALAEADEGDRAMGRGREGGEHLARLIGGALSVIGPHLGVVGEADLLRKKRSTVIPAERSESRDPSSREFRRSRRVPMHGSRLALPRIKCGVAWPG